MIFSPNKLFFFIFFLKTKFRQKIKRFCNLLIRIVFGMLAETQVNCFRPKQGKIVTGRPCGSVALTMVRVLVLSAKVSGFESRSGHVHFPPLGSQDQAPACPNNSLIRNNFYRQSQLSLSAVVSYTLSKMCALFGMTSGQPACFHLDR